MIEDKDITINGDGKTSRDFCYVANAVQANIRASLAPTNSQGEVYNVAVGHRTTLLELFDMLKDELAQHQIHYGRNPVHADFRKGDVRHSQAYIGKAQQLLGYDPTYSVQAGIKIAMPWYVEQHRLQNH